MPHKKNPILSENLTGLARLLRSYAQAGLEDVALWHERDISHSSVERVAMPDATILADFMTARATGARRRASSSTRAGCARTSIAPAGCSSPRRCCSRSSRPGLPRQEAYVIVQRAALAAISEAASMGHVGALPGRFRELLGARSRHRGAARRRGARRLLRSRPPPAPRAARSSSARSGGTRDDRRSMPTLRAQLGAHARRHAVARRSAAARSPRYDGKVRDCFIDARARRAHHRRDRPAVSAFDAVVGTIPFKGQVLNQLAQFWFEQTAAHRAEPHAARARSERDDRARVRAAAGRARHARVPDRRHVDVDLEGLRGRRAHVLRPRAARGHEEEPAAAAGRSSRRRRRPRRATTTSRSRATSCSRWAASIPSVFDRAAAIAARAVRRRPGATPRSSGLILADTKYEMGLDARRRRSS